MRRSPARHALFTFGAAITLLGLGAAVAPGPPSALAQQPPGAKVTVSLPFERYALANGLTVILHEDHRTPVVAVNLWYHVGSKDEPSGKNGFAHLFEHVMFQGSRNVGEDMFFKYLERAGASDRNGTTNSDRTNYYETLPSNQLALALWLESDRMGFLLDHADEKTFASQRDVVKNERRQNYENAPYGLVRQFVRAAVYPPSHPYHLLTIGTPQDLDAATLEDVRAFFRAFYVPNNASLVIAGDIDKAKTRDLVEKYFGPLPRGATPKTQTTPIPAGITAEKRLEIEAEVELPRLSMTWDTPPRYKPGDGELDLVAEVLSTGKTSRLYKRLVYDLQIAQDVSAFQASGLLASTFEIVVTLKKDQAPLAALKLVDEEIAKLRAAPPSEDELERARAELVSQLIFDSERVTSRANAFNEYLQMTGDPGYFDKNIARYQQAKPADLQKAVVTYLPTGARVIAIVTPTPGAPRAGRLIGSF